MSEEITEFDWKLTKNSTIQFRAVVVFRVFDFYVASVLVLRGSWFLFSFCRLVLLLMLPAFKWETFPCPGLIKHIHAPYMQLTCFFFPFPFLTGELQTQFDDDDDDDDTSNQVFKADTPRLYDDGYYLLVWLKDRLLAPLDYSVATLCYTLSDTMHDWLSNIQDLNTITHYLLPWLWYSKTKPFFKTSILITHYSATMTSMLQYSKVLFPSSQGCTALILKAPFVYTSLFIYSGPPRFSQGNTSLKTLILCCQLLNTLKDQYVIKLLLPLIQCPTLGSFSFCCSIDSLLLGLISITTLSDMMHYWYLC